MSWLNQIAERRIREAMDRGAFDDCLLKGKPLVLESNPLVPEDIRLAYKLLKDAGFLPPEMELRKEICTLKDLLRAIDDQSEKLRLAREINDRVLRLNLAWRRTFSHEDRQVYVAKLRKKLG
jgi:hypothetical protein